MFWYPKLNCPNSSWAWNWLEGGSTIGTGAAKGTGAGAAIWTGAAKGVGARAGAGAKGRGAGAWKGTEWRTGWGAECINGALWTSCRGTGAIGAGGGGRLWTTGASGTPYPASRAWEQARRDPMRTLKEKCSLSVTSHTSESFFPYQTPHVVGGFVPSSAETVWSDLALDNIFNSLGWCCVVLVHMDGWSSAGTGMDGVMLEAIVTPSTQQLTPHSSSRRTGFSVPDKEGCGLMMNEDIIHGAVLMVNTTVEWFGTTYPKVTYGPWLTKCSGEKFNWI